MRTLSPLVLALLFSLIPATAQEAQFQPVGTISELMVDIIYPLSDEFFYVMREPPETDYDWTLLRRSALTLAEAGNLLMIQGRSIQQEDWMAHAKRLVEVGTEAYEAAVAGDLEAIVELSPALEASCRACHEQYHPRYRRRPPQNPEN
jgi:hypothetical protein